MSNPNNVSAGDMVTYWDEDGDSHDAVVIDTFDRPSGYGAYVHLVYNPDEKSFGANTLDGLEDDTSVPHRMNGGKERTWTTEWV